MPQSTPEITPRERALTFKDGKGNRQTEIEWHRITCFNDVGKRVAVHAVKGPMTEEDEIFSGSSRWCAMVRGSVMETRHANISELENRSSIAGKPHLISAAKSD
jgi:hypothetical protein